MRVLLAFALLPPLASASGGGGASADATFLETPTYLLALLLLFFLVVSQLFERSAHALIRHFERRKRVGLAAATRTLVDELVLVGFVSLLLIAFQDSIAQICGEQQPPSPAPALAAAAGVRHLRPCRAPAAALTAAAARAPHAVPYKQSVYERWSILAKLPGCECCLAHTAGVGNCFQLERQCGERYCNCGAQNATCVGEPRRVGDTLARVMADEECACGQEYAREIAESLGARAAAGQRSGWRRLRGRCVRPRRSVARGLKVSLIFCCCCSFLQT